MGPHYGVPFFYGYSTDDFPGNIFPVLGVVMLIRKGGVVLNLTLTSLRLEFLHTIIAVLSGFSISV